MLGFDRITFDSNVMGGHAFEACGSRCLLRNLGYDAVHLHELGLDRLSDSEILASVWPMGL